MGVFHAAGAPAAARRFTAAEVANRELVIRMLQHEEAITRSAEGQARYATPGMGARTTLNIELGFQRETLRHFGFGDTDDDVAVFRTIFRTYYNGPRDYDAAVLGASHYMRANRCVYYTAPELEVGDAVPDLPLAPVDAPDAPVTVHGVLRAQQADAGASRVVLHAFSAS